MKEITVALSNSGRNSALEEEEGQPPTSPMARLVTMMTNANPTTAAVEDAGSVAGQETVLRDKLAGIYAF